RSIFKIVDLDEAWSFLQVAQGKALSMRLVRAGRAMNAGVYFVTQNADDLLDEKMKNNIGLKFAFRSTDLVEIKKTLEFFGVDKEARTIYKSPIRLNVEPVAPVEVAIICDITSANTPPIIPANAIDPPNKKAPSASIVFTPKLIMSPPIKRPNKRLINSISLITANELACRPTRNERTNSVKPNSSSFRVWLTTWSAEIIIANNPQNSNIS